MNLAACGAWALPFVLVSYLALRGGGYDIVPRSQAGIAVWWLVLVAAAAGLLPARVGARAWIPVGLLAAFALWTGLATGWSQSAEQTVTELGRIAAYLGILVITLAVQGRAAARHTVNGLASAIGLITVLSVLSRLHPQAFGANDHFQFLSPVSARKLSYPLGYWNALAAFAAMGVPLLLAGAAGARTLAGRALAAAVLPLSAVCVYLTVSRGGVIAVGVGVAVFLLIAPRRLETVATLLVAALGAFIVIRAIAGHAALASGVPTPAAIHQGTQVLWLAIGVCLGAGVVQLAITRAARHPRRPAILTPGRRTTARLALGLAAAAIVIALAAGAPTKLTHAWHDFKQPMGAITPGNENTVFGRLSVANGNNRYQIWHAALNAFSTDPLKGIGPGTFQFWWAAHPTASGYIRNAHSLYFETLAETGIVGALLLIGVLIWFVAVAVRRALADPPELRLWIAAASAGLAVFLFAASVEWVWQLAAIAAAALVLGAVIVAGRDGPAGATPANTPRPRSRAALAVLSLAALVAIVIPLSTTLAVRASQAAAQRGQLGTALADTRGAEGIEPYASSGHLQEALVLEAAGELNPAATAARAATADSPTDWTTWLTLARIDARRGAETEALAAIRQARALNPHSVLFQRP